ncbi:TPA: hypothetical protein DCQ44_02040 [Candidatus Taylorbacteria bacterium]|nr:hypothetical protein [Candidatus Taylorbacteria bacterium]
MSQYIKFTSKITRILLIISAVILSQTAFVTLAHAESYITLSSFSGSPAQTITASGGGWPAGDLISIYFSSVGGTPVTTTTAAADGTFSTGILIPANAPQGALPIIAADASSTQKANSYYVVPLQASITSTANSHAPFGTVTVNGTGFAPNENVLLDLAGATNTVGANAAGSFTGTLTVPAVPTGLYSIKATGQSSEARSTDYLNFFWIDAFYTAASPSAYYLMPGDTLTFTGSGFASSETITVTSGPGTTVGTFTANPTGSFTNGGGVVIPMDYAGTNKTFTLTGSLSKIPVAMNVTIGSFFAYASPTLYYILPSEKLGFNGGGFAGNETVNVLRTSDSTNLGHFLTDKTGSFENAGSITVPSNVAGTTIGFTLVGASSHAQAQVLVGVGSYYPTITPSDYYVQSNSAVTISGAGFAPNETVDLTILGTASTKQISTTALGTFSTSIIVPFNPKNMATITAKGAISNNLATVDITLATFYPTVTPSTYYTFPGSTISFTGSGFVPSESVSISTGGATSTAIQADLEGKFTTAPIIVPFSKLLTLSYSFTGSLSNNPVTGSIAIGTLSPFLQSDLYSASPGQTVHLSGTSFAAGETVTVTAGKFTTTAVASSSGDVGPVPIVIPFNAGASLHVVFTGNSTGATASLDISLGAFYPTVTSDNYYVSPGAKITLSASGFAPNETLNATSTGISVSAQTDTLGSADIPLTIPFGNVGQTINITVKGSQSGSATTITINLAPLSAQVSPNSYYVTPGGTIIFTGTSFAPSESVSVTLNGTASTPATADINGAFTKNLKAPFNATLAHVVFTGAVSGASVPIDISLAQFYSSIVLSNYYAQGGTPLTITGGGFGPTEVITLSIDSTTFGTANTDTNGSFTYVGTVPFGAAGSKTIRAVATDSSAVAVSPITIAPVYTSFNLGSYAGAPGTAITLSGSGYLPNEPISITTDRTGATVVASATTNALGDFSISYSTPTTFAEGNLVITAKSAHSFDIKSITYYVTGI